MHNQQSDNPFWLYACERYQKPAVQESLLLLQDYHDLNINVLLLMSWLGEMRVSITSEQLDIFIDGINNIDSKIILPLRNIRRFIKTDKAISADYYVQIKQLESDFEQFLINKLYDLSLNIKKVIVKTPCVEHNIALYIDNYGTDACGALANQKQTLLKDLI